MSKKLVSDLLMDYPERRDVTKLFGLCGHTVIGMLDALSRSKKIECVSMRHEAIASTAADGYARITHKAAVVMCHLGPGLTNVITGVANAENPVLHAGGGILLSQASEELAALAEFLDIPVSRTLAGQGCLSDQHPLMIGQTGFWGLEATHAFTLNADVILALSTRFGEADSSSWYQGVTFDPDKTTFLQIDIDPSEIGRNYPVEIGAQGDLKIGLAQILDEVKKICPEGKTRPGMREKIAAAKAEFKKSNEAISSDSRFPMTPQHILKDVREVIPEDAIIFTDVVWNKNGVAQEFDITIPGTIHHSSGLATMGFGPAAVLGGKVAAPDRIVLNLTGDGGFGINPSVWFPPPAAGTSTISTPPTSWLRKASWSRRRTASTSLPATPNPTTPDTGPE